MSSPLPIEFDAVAFGHQVTFKRDDGHRHALRIVGEDEADPRKRRRRRQCLHARSVAGQYQLLLVYRRGWVFVLPVLYYLRRHRPWVIPADAAVKAPTGYAEFPREMLRPPRSLAKKMFVDISALDRDEEGRPLCRDGD
jgi:hypothetical protein